MSEDEQSLEDLTTEYKKLKLQKDILKEREEIRKLTVVSEEHTAYIENLERRERYIRKWEATRDSKEKGMVAVHDRIMAEVEIKLNEANELVSKLLGYIGLGKLSEYRDLDRRLDKSDLDILEGIVVILKKEQQ